MNNNFFDRRLRNFLNNTQNFYCLDVNNSVIESKNVTEFKHNEISFNLFEEKINLIINKIKGSDKSVSLQYKDTELLKKYILLHLYKTPIYQSNFSIPKINLSELELYKNETFDNLYEKVEKILFEYSFEEIMKDNILGLKKHISTINASYVIFLKTEEEFFMNDIGYVNERVDKYNISMSKEDYLNKANSLGKILFGETYNFVPIEE